MILRTPTLVLFACIAAACAAAPAPAPALAPPAAGEWKTWSHDRKLAYMKANVLPHEQTYFHVYSPQRFREITCKTCHGPAADDGSYKMPNPAILQLTPGKILELEKTKPNAFNFMLKVIVPRTAELLGEPEWSHETMSGFGCFKCHAVDREALAIEKANEKK
jgi:hypothetical protein